MRRSAFPLFWLCGGSGGRILGNLRIVALLLALLLASCSPQPVTPIPSRTSTLPPPSATPTLAPSPTATPLPAQWGFRARSALGEGLPPAANQAEWTFQSQAALFSSPAIGQERAYVGGLDGVLYAVDLKTGKEAWTFKPGGEIISSPALDGESLYFGSLDGNLYALKASSGEQRWVFKTGGQVISSPAVVDGLVYFGSLDKTFYVLDAQSGKEVWKYATQGGIISSPAVEGEQVYFGSQDGFLYALDRQSGAKQWLFLSESPIQSSALVSSDTLYIGSDGGVLYAVDRQSGKKKWQFQARPNVISTPALYGEWIYFGETDNQGTFYALQARSGELAWKFEAKSPIISSPVVSDGLVYFGSINGRFYALEADSGQERWRIQTMGEIESSPVIAGDLVYVSSFDKTLYALRKEGPQLALAPTPTSGPILPTPTLMPEPSAPIPAGTDGKPWWNDQIFYEVFVRSFADSNGDGDGDLQGLIGKLDYLNDGDPQTNQDLGVTGLWLMPVNESPSYHGYDVIDYKKVEQDYGTNQDLKQLIDEAHKRGMLVIIDLVMNHTSSENPWFLEAVTPGSQHDNWYIWSTERPSNTRSWDGAQVWYQAGVRYYYALFWSGMPDLNFENGAVTEAMFDIIRFWLEDMEVDGFRLDAVRHLIEAGAIDSNTPATHQWLQGFHRYVRTVNPKALTVGEAWTTPDQIAKYIGGEVDLAFEFGLAQATLDSLRAGSNSQLLAAQKVDLESFPVGQYATFLTNHDQDRTLTQLRNNVEAAKQAATLLLTSPGVPFIYYGEEVGMKGSVNNHASDEQVRTPMQWEAATAVGFSSGTPWLAPGPGAEQFNVAAEDNDRNSLLWRYRELIHLRLAHPALRAGDMLLVSSDQPGVYSFLRASPQETLLVVANLTGEAISDYHLALESGPLSGRLRARMVWGQGQPGAPQVSASGGFEAYQPLPGLAPYGTLVISLQ